MAAVVAALILAACGGDEPAGVDRETFRAGIEERYDASPAEAACITDEVYADYDDAAIDRLHEEGPTALSQALWDPYFYAVIGCLVDPADLAP